MGSFQTLLLFPKSYYPFLYRDSPVNLRGCRIIQRGLCAQRVPHLIQVGAVEYYARTIQGAVFTDLYSSFGVARLDIGIAEHRGFEAVAIRDDIQYFGGVAGVVVTEPGEGFQYG